MPVAGHGLLPSGHDQTLAARRSDLPSLSPWGLVREKLLNRPLGLAPTIVVHAVLIGTVLGSLELGIDGPEFGTVRLRVSRSPCGGLPKHEIP